MRVNGQRLGALRWLAWQQYRFDHVPRERARRAHAQMAIDQHEAVCLAFGGRDHADRALLTALSRPRSDGGSKRRSVVKRVGAVLGIVVVLAWLVLWAQYWLL